MKIRYAPLAVACALMVAAAATTTAQAAAVTYYFGGTLDSVDAGLPSLSIGNSFTGSFTFESTSVNRNSFPLPYVGDYGDSSFAIEGTVNGHSFLSTTTSTCSLNCVAISVYDEAPTLVDFFQVANFGLRGEGVLPVTGPNLDGIPPSFLLLQLGDQSGAVFNSVALPSNLALSSFDDTRFLIVFEGIGQQARASGPLTYLSTTAPPIPEASTSAMLAVGLGALALMRRRKAY